uniref:hypothetical protein n=1 Tax=Flexithrix dorotheae TaxID=70993 RepID=UPI0004774A4E
ISNSQIENNGNSNSINGGLKIITVDQDQSTFLYTCSIKNNSGKQMKNDVHQVAYHNSKNYLQIQDSDFTHTIYFSEESGGQNLVLDSNGDKIKLIDKINYKTLINLADHSFPK